jgi:murein DD-endopeptidase MepM/ murein hydrolase activator NlpD
MAHKLSFIVLGSSGSKIKQIHLSARQITSMVVALIVCIGLAIYGGVDYLMLRSQIAGKKQLETQLAQKTTEADFQRKEIQKFAEEINGLKDCIVATGKFEDHIRVLANLDQPNTKDGVFGVGGSTPEDLKPNVELDKDQHQLIKQMHQQVHQLGDASQQQQKALAHLLDRLKTQKNILAHTPAIRPAKGWITSTFAYRESPFTGRREFHKGLDIANHPGTPIMAPADGVVSFFGPDGGYGNLMVIDHGFGITTRFGHLEKGLKKKGDHVHRGDIIALMGDTGHSTGPHVHYEVRINGVPVNPEKYILN